MGIVLLRRLCQSRWAAVLQAAEGRVPRALRFKVSTLPVAPQGAYTNLLEVAVQLKVELPMTVTVGSMSES
jgi:hypothetical protein